MVEVRPLAHQIDDLIAEARRAVERHERVLVTTLTKRSAEDLSAYLREIGLRVTHLHSDIDALERVDILQRLRRGEFDVLVGINLLREGLDLPEVALVAILDADKEGFLRSTTSLVQTAGRAARHVEGRVILYADHETEAMREFLALTKDHRARQEAYNAAHHVTPRAVVRAIKETDLKSVKADGRKAGKAARVDADRVEDAETLIREWTAEMAEAVRHLEFERAAYLRDQIKQLRKKQKK